LLISPHSTFLHILLVGRCCFYIQRKNRSFRLGDRVLNEEEVLLALMERRKQLEEETGGLEATRRDDDPPPLPGIVDTGIGQHEEDSRRVEEDLIDMESDER
jgi:hypothetical protein